MSAKAVSYGAEGGMNDLQPVTGPRAIRFPADNAGSHFTNSATGGMIHHGKDSDEGNAVRDIELTKKGQGGDGLKECESEEAE